MRNFLIITLVILLSGCVATPVKRNFPNVPEELQVTCPDLQEVNPETTKLSEVISVVSLNYGQYHECRIKIDTWIDWYKNQKTIFESVK